MSIFQRLNEAARWWDVVGSTPEKYDFLEPVVTGDIDSDYYA